uniref:Uncharacterized protein n=1 Tax=Nelumbo nucifera TaxID=4432 RepID=A0A822ZPX2_NELNU|nr:TPA_asm: hypothetical protein HUJ06_017971 [Nelumbo nucifera]
MGVTEEEENRRNLLLFFKVASARSLDLGRGRRKKKSDAWQLLSPHLCLKSDVAEHLFHDCHGYYCLGALHLPKDPTRSLSLICSRTIIHRRC